MKKGKLGVIIGLIVVVLAAFGVIDKDTANKILSGSGSTGQTIERTSQNNGNVAPTGKNNSPHGWSKTKPEINLSHVFQGEINRNGKPTGFHSRPGGIDPKNARLKQLKARKNRAGVYSAQVEVFDAKEKRWKKKFSTFFPDSMSSQQVIASISNAWKNRKKGKATPWQGPSGKGFQIEGYVTRRGGINTAYPIYVRD